MDSESDKLGGKGKESFVLLVFLMLSLYFWPESVNLNTIINTFKGILFRNLEHTHSRVSCELSALDSFVSVYFFLGVVNPRGLMTSNACLIHIQVSIITCCHDTFIDYASCLSIIKDYPRSR